MDNVIQRGKRAKGNVPSKSLFTLRDARNAWRPRMLHCDDPSRERGGVRRQLLGGSGVTLACERAINGSDLVITEERRRPLKFQTMGSLARRASGQDGRTAQWRGRGLVAAHCPSCGKGGGRGDQGKVVGSRCRLICFSFHSLPPLYSVGASRQDFVPQHPPPPPSSPQFLSTPDNSGFEVRQTVRYKRHELSAADMERGADGGGDGRRTGEKEITKVKKSVIQKNIVYDEE